MKRVIHYLLWLCLLLPSVAHAYPTDIQEAVVAVKQHFAGQDIDIYGIDTNSPTYWSLFIDADPQKGWEHDCFIAYVPKVGPFNQSEISWQKLKMPPSWCVPYPIEVKERYGSNATVKPMVKKWNLGSNQVQPSEEAGRTYALIISGGWLPISNYERYWNDCSFIYQTLVNKYGVPKANIYPLMSDGNDPEPDMRLTDRYEFCSQSLDLDFDGNNEIELAATRDNIRNVLSNLAQRLDENDHLFIYVIDHGGTDDRINSSYICLWNQEQLYDHELTAWLKPLSDNNVNLSLVLGQCFSGGFIDDLRSIHCVVAAASTGAESSWACGDIPYDEFVYQWTSAANEATATGMSLKIDMDNNRHVCMDEIFNFAKNHDRQTKEHPQFSSTPQMSGKELAFTKHPPVYDLYIRDNLADVGDEPNTTTDIFWTSPDIWVRNYPDSIEEHENPYLSDTHLNAFVNVRVHNRGRGDYNAKNTWVHLYWARAATGLTDAAFKGYETDEFGRPTGEHGRAMIIGPIKSGESTVCTYNWNLPWDYRDEIGTNSPEQQHFCLIARLMNQSYDDGYEPGKKYFQVAKRKDQAQLNVSIVRVGADYRGTSVHIRNVKDTPSSYSLEFVPETEKDKQLYAISNVKIKMTNPIYNGWQNGGCQGQNIQHNATTSPLEVVLTSPENKIEGIRLDPGQFDKITMDFKFNALINFFPNRSFRYNLIQRDENDSIIGGETFIIITPSKSTSSPNVKIENSDDEFVTLTVTDSDVSNVIWFNDNDEAVGEGPMLEVAKKSKKQTFTVTAFDADGEMSDRTIEIEAYTGIKDVTVNAGTATVELKVPSGGNAEVRLSSFTDPAVMLTKNLDKGQRDASFDVNSLRGGIYVASLYINGQLVDSKKFTLD